jgi:hypothetical protein
MTTDFTTLRQQLSQATDGREVRLHFADGDEAFATIRHVGETHALVRLRGNRHPIRVNLAILAGVTELHGGAP